MTNEYDNEKSWISNGLFDKILSIVLGLGAEGEESLFMPTPLLAFGASAGPVKAISCGYYHSALVTMPFSDATIEAAEDGGNPGKDSKIRILYFLV